jgi:polyphosphate kinase
MGEDVHKLFLQLTGLGRVARLKKIRQAPFDLQRSLIALIDGEAESARRGKRSRIAAKMNALSEPRVIQALYRASRAGVPIDLVVRGICCLRPGVPGVSENIRVRSIVGRFLEHSRIFHFHAEGRELTFCASADWMQRSFFSRVEACFPIEDARLKARVLQEGIEVHLADTVQAWVLQPDGKYRRARPGKDRALASQERLIESYGA